MASHVTGPWVAASDDPIDRDGPDLPFRPFDAVGGLETPIVDLIAAAAEVRPNHLAVRDDEVVLTYGELILQSRALAARIAAKVPAGHPVGIRLAETASIPLALLACLMAATPAVLLNHADPPERFAGIAARSRLAAIITTDDLPGHDCIAPLGHFDAPFENRPLAQDAPAFVVWTSGSSGQPKGIVQSQRSILHRAGLLVNSGHLGAADRYLSLNTATSVGGLINAIAAFLAGATLHRVSLSRHGLAGALRRVRDEQVTAVIGVPAIYRALARLSGAGASLSSLRLLSSNGEALLAADLALLRQKLPDGCMVQMVYGATETQAAMRFVPRDEVPDGPQVAAGRPIPGTEFALLRDDGAPAAPGEAGELVIRSRWTSIGEWQDGRCVPGRLLPDNDAGPGWRRYAMGDIVRLRPDGVFVVIGRADRQLKLNGLRIEPIELEAVLRSDPSVLDAAVLPVPGPVGPELVAFVVGSSGTDDTLRLRLVARLASSLPPPMRPRRLHLLASLPLLSGNKIDAVALARLDAAMQDTL